MSDIKRKSREAIRMPDDYPGPLRIGESASDQNRFWWVRAQSWSEGACVNSYADIEIENEENLRIANIPYTDYQPGPMSERRNTDGVSTEMRGSAVRVGPDWQAYVETRKK